MAIGRVEHGVHGSGLHDDVRIEQQDVIRLVHAHAHVAAAGVALVTLVQQPLHFWEALPHRGQAGGGRRIVYHDDTKVAAWRTAAQRLETPREIVAGIVVDDDDGQFQVQDLSAARELRVVTIRVSF